MGSIGGMFGTAGGMGGTGFNTTPGTNSGQLNNSYNAAQGGMGNQSSLLAALQNQGGLGNQSQVYNQYQNIAAGQGPNPAQAMLNQATGANVANQAAQAAGQRGASQNVGLLQRQSAQTGAQAQQQAAGQGASMQAQQALGALGQAGSMANTMAANQIGQTNANVQAQQNEQSILQGANTSNNSIQGQLANTGLQGQQKATAGLMNGIGAIAGLAGGGEVDGGAAFGPQSMFGQFISSPTPGTPSFGGDNSGGQIGQNWGKKQKTATDPMAGSTNAVQDASGTPGGSMFVGNDAGAAQATPGMIASAHGGNIGSKLKQGGHVPGQAKVKGNDYKNDTVKALLSPGEVVIPRSVMQSGDPVNGAASFVRSVMAKKGKRA